MTHLPPLRYPRWIFTILLASATIYGFLNLANWHAQGGRLLSVQTSSMVPTFRPGDALLVHKTTLANLKPGEVISYRNAQNSKLIISHRLVNIDRQTSSLTTKGDALPQPDPQVSQSQLVGQVTAVAPRAGWLLDFLHRPIGLILAIYIPASVIGFSEILHYLKQAMPRSYRLAGYR